MTESERISKIIEEVMGDMPDWCKEVYPGMFQFTSGNMVLLTGAKGKEDMEKALEKAVKDKYNI